MLTGQQSPQSMIQWTEWRWESIPQLLGCIKELTISDHRYRDVQVVLQHMDNLGPTSTLSLKLLTFKLAKLSLTRLFRLAELAALQLDRC